MKKQNRYLHRARAVSSTLVIRISEKCMLRTQSDIKPHSKKYLQNMYSREREVVAYNCVYSIT